MKKTFKFYTKLTKTCFSMRTFGLNVLNNTDTTQHDKTADAIFGQ